ncbi:hypothetical protein F2Q70_00037996 [Brassica cretica]|uniref:Uncharacterized protein n=1 Tax=Brassica cretica TaxID=69181 RepID=A0A8S9KCB2_BRACR|nr:hypothetical protein F2Q70_00037996 [Brassica cretica]
MKKPLYNMDPHACYVLRVRGRWAIGGNTFNEIFVFFKVNIDLYLVQTPSLAFDL